MIGRVAGRLLSRGADHVLVDARGLGLIVHVSDRTLAAMPRVGEAVALYTELQVREDGWTLFGFTTPVEKEWHRLLLTVQGVGAKVSLSLLGALGADGLGRAVALGDWASLARAKNVGPKTAQRIANELRDKAPAVMALAGLGGATPAAPDPEDGEVVEAVEAPEPKAPRRPRAPQGPDAGRVQADALSALQNLGYAPSDAVQAVAQAVEASPGADAPAVIRAALRLLAPKDR